MSRKVQSVDAWSARSADSKMLPLEATMGMPVKLSDELVESARKEAANADRSITGQIEHWEKIARSVETILRNKEVQGLKRTPQTATLAKVARRAVESALE